MTARTRPGAGGPGACPACLRRSWLLGQLSAALDYRCRDPSRFLDVFSLEQDELLAALGGRRRAELAGRLRELQASDLAVPDHVDALCRHDPRYPASLAGRSAPHMLFVSGGSARLRMLARAPTVAFLGSARASDYGLETARGLARALAASGVTIAGSLAEGVPAAAQEGAREARGETVAVLAHGLGACPSARRRRGLWEHLQRHGCVLSELPCGASGRRFGALAAERTVAQLATVVVVVEAKAGSRELAGATIARDHGRAIAAVPGRISSALASGPHALLRQGATLVRGPEDVLELLYPEQADRAAAARTLAVDGGVALTRSQRALLQAVAAGSDGPERLCDGNANPGEVLLALSELELMGLLVRGRGGRYLPRPGPAI
jgi:DNA processing protein